MDWFNARSIVEDNHVRDMVNNFTEKFPRFNDAWYGLTWLLARNAEKIYCKKGEYNGRKLFLYKANSLHDSVPTITVIFSLTDESVEIHGINAE